jgi:hypothetical protein
MPSSAYPSVGDRILELRKNAIREAVILHAYRVEGDTRKKNAGGSPATADQFQSAPSVVV